MALSAKNKELKQKHLEKLDAWLTEKQNAREQIVARHQTQLDELDAEIADKQLLKDALTALK